MIASKAPHPNCAYMWMKYISTPKVQAQQAIVLRRDAGQHGPARSWTSSSQGSCAQYHANAPAAYFDSDQVLEDADRRLRQRRDELHGLQRSGSRRGRRSRASCRGAAAEHEAGRRHGRPAAALSAAFWRRPVAAGHRCCSSRRSAGSCSIYLASLGVAAASRPSGSSTRSPARSSTPGASTTSARIFARATVPAHHRPDGRDRRRGDGHRRGARVPVRLLHGPGRDAADARRCCSWSCCCRCGRATSARIYAWRLILDEGRRAQLVARRARARRAAPRLHELGDVIVFSYIWLPFMILPVYAALERIPDSLLEASRDLGAQELDDVPPGGAPLALPGRRRRLDLHVLADARRLHHADARRQDRSSSATSSTATSASTNNLPVRRRLRDGADRDHGRLPARRAAARRVRGALMETRAGTRIGLRVWVVLRRARSCTSRSCSSSSTPSTPRTSRAGRSRASRRSWFRGRLARRRRSRTRSVLSVKAALVATAIALRARHVAAVRASRASGSSAGRRSRSCWCCRSRCPGSSPGSR